MVVTSSSSTTSATVLASSLSMNQRRRIRKNHPLLATVSCDSSYSESSFSKDELVPAKSSVTTVNGHANHAGIHNKKNIRTTTNAKTARRAKKQVRFANTSIEISDCDHRHAIIDDVHDDSSNSTTNTDLWYTAVDYRRFRSRESKLTKEMSRSFNGASFSVDGVESALYKREKHHRMNNARLDVLLQQESFWQLDELSSVASDEGSVKDKKPTQPQQRIGKSHVDDEGLSCSKDEFDHHHYSGDVVTTVNEIERRVVELAKSYSIHSLKAMQLAIERGEWNENQVKDNVP